MTTDDGSNNDSGKPKASSAADDTSTMFSSWKLWFDELSDGQRLDRLRSCAQLDQILKTCQDRQHQQLQQSVISTKNGVNRSKKDGGEGDGGDVPPDLIEGSSQGIRSMKYFGWRGILTSSSSPDTTSDGHEDNTDGDRNINDETSRLSLIRQSCSREQHAVWACRAVATGCGNELSKLRSCFDSGGGCQSNDDREQVQQRRPVFTMMDILTTTQTAYHLGDTSGSSVPKNMMNIPCYDRQIELGQCVTKQAQALLERKRHREQRGEK